MKSNYTISSAKDQLIRCGMRFQGKKIMGSPPGIKGWGAIDFLETKDYSYGIEIPKPRTPQSLLKTFLMLGMISKKMKDLGG